MLPLHVLLNGVNHHRATAMAFGIAIAAGVVACDTKSVAPMAREAPSINVTSEAMESAFYKNSEAAAQRFNNGVRVSGRVEDLDVKEKTVDLYLHPEIRAAINKATSAGRKGDWWAAFKHGLFAVTSRHFAISARLADDDGFRAMRKGSVVPLDCEQVEQVEPPRVLLGNCSLATGCGDPANADKAGLSVKSFAAYVCRERADGDDCLGRTAYATPDSPLGCPEGLLCCAP
jgi:hypothetical protein